ncbi:hypothetical protein [Actinomadura fibrosa]|uniref:Uncharacterized protein n=1 Tax=Actinomadura fibrosa TaxID=111802 RepID=A0ABW2XJY3_9ACTN|nr:hypothetical protein [Actinomadura fibrosa]
MVEREQPTEDEEPPRRSRFKTIGEVLGLIAAVATVVGLVVQVLTSMNDPDPKPTPSPDGGSPSPPTGTPDRNYQLSWDGSVRISLNERVDLDVRPPSPSPVDDNWAVSGPDTDNPQGALLAPRQGGVTSWGPSRPPTPAECRTVLAQGKRHIFGFTAPPSYLCLITPQGKLGRLQYVSSNGTGYQTYYEFQITLWLIQ